MQWQDSYNESLTAYTNNIPQRDGGTHVTGLRGAMTRVLKNYIAKNELAKKSKVDPDGDDMREGLTCVLSVKIPQPKFSSQFRAKYDLLLRMLFPVSWSSTSNKILLMPN